MTYNLPKTKNTQIEVIRFRMYKGSVRELEVFDDSFPSKKLYKTTDCQTLLTENEELARDLMPFEAEAIEVSKDFDCWTVCIFRDYGLKVCTLYNEYDYDNGYKYEDATLLYTGDIVDIRNYREIKAHYNSDRDITKIVNKLDSGFYYNLRTKKVTWEEFTFPEPQIYKIADFDKDEILKNIQTSENRFEI